MHELSGRKEQSDFRADLRAGIIASTTANVFSEGKRWKPADFMPFQEQVETAQTPEEVSGFLHSLFPQKEAD